MVDANICDTLDPQTLDYDLDKVNLVIA